MAWLAALAVAAGGGLLVFSQTPGPVPSSLPAPPPVVPGTAVPPQAPAKSAARDLSRLTLVQKQMLASAQRGADWLLRSLRADGRFGYVSAPALRLRQENDHYLRQAGAALALARSARFSTDKDTAAAATQAVLTLLLATAPDDAKNPQTRCTTVPNSAINRLASAGLLIEAVHELPAPADDLLKQADELCSYVRSRQKADGSLRAADGPEGGAGENAELAAAFAAEALHGLARSAVRRPAPWKADVLRKALAFYYPRWQTHKSLATAPRLAGAWAEAYLMTNDRTFADAAFAMCDWLCTLQYQQLEPQRSLWIGGFMGWADGRPVTQPPEIDAARYLEALAEGCRVAQQLGDAQRHTRYREAVERGMPFLLTLQYTAGNTQHFADWYQREIAGGFHASPQDGNLRLDYTQHAVGALLHYLTYVAEAP
jgi:hypothetical protein